MMMIMMMMARKLRLDSDSPSSDLKNFCKKKKKSKIYLSGSQDSAVSVGFHEVLDDIGTVLDDSRLVAFILDVGVD